MLSNYFTFGNDMREGRSTKCRLPLENGIKIDHDDDDDDDGLASYYEINL